ncbi:serine protease, putative [Ichthyophthirius multifiliis]|uniref:Serine protease, putative n=1 Tax=Ichthyophthirius multifiliis TaxID=5932 RepID=G0QNS2_ICHMU|nr:serine protease, putative [Ichthyophthirius multifiliis]EGR33113.1 serine protease, putative [Ichthyophthirius multifiliis]|eukprot:XP_004037099.1 serine protease, putative [Ichthyophthirius multifiliis]
MNYIEKIAKQLVSLRKTKPQVSFKLNLKMLQKSGLYAQAYEIAKYLEVFQKENNIPVYTFAEEKAYLAGYLLLCSGKESYCDPISLVGNFGIKQQNLKIHDQLVNRLGLTACRQIRKLLRCIQKALSWCLNKFSQACRQL